MNGVNPGRIIAMVLEWKANGDKTYTLTFADGATETASVDAEHGLITIGEVVYQKYPSELSGLVIGEDIPVLLEDN